MYKKFFMGIAAMAALTLVSCSSDDLNSFSDNSSKNEAISFDGYLGRSAVAVNGSRGGVETATTLKTNGFGVFSKYNGTGSFPDFSNQKVTYSETNKKWTYSPLKFWPTQGNIVFYAYAPFVENKTLNNTSFDFTVAEKAADQQDLLWANATGQITENSGSTKEKVKIHFYHALSRLGYTVKLSGNYSSNNVTFTLKNITLAGSTDGNTPAFYKTGTINLAKTNNDTGVWSNYTGGKLKFNWYSGEYNIPEPKAGTEPSPSHPDKDNNGTIEKDKDYLFVIPQNFPEKIEDPEHSGQQIDNPDKLYVIVEYTIDYGGGVKVDNKVYKRLTREFKQGKAYMLNLTLGLPIEFDVDLTEGVGVEGWGADENINIGSNDNPWER